MTDIMNSLSQVSDLTRNSIAPTYNGKELAKAKQTAQDFEAFFLSKSIESMYEGVGDDEMFGGGEAEKMYRSLLIDEYGKQIAKSGGVGVADNVMNFMLAQQEVPATTTSQGVQ